MTNNKMMTSEELDRISKEVDCLADYLLLLNPLDPMEQELREHLWKRWNFLRSQIKSSLLEARRRRFHVVPNNMKH